MACVTILRLIGRGLAALALRLIVAVAYATGFNAVIFLPLSQVRAQTLPVAAASKEQQPPAAGGGLAEAIVSPAAAADSSLAYDSGNTYGDVGQISSGSAGFALALTRDAHTRQVTAQTITNNATDKTVLTAAMSYDPMGRRTSRTVTAVDEGSGSSVTEYWYGDALVPLVVERDGNTYRMIGGLVIEERVGGQAQTQYYPHRDYASSVRVVTDGTGAVAASLGYDGDWGSARIAGQDYVSSDNGMEVFYRFQDQEAEIFPLSALDIQDSALEGWLDDLQIYHFPYREYSAGLAIFLSQDPARESISPYAAFGANPVNIIDPTGAIDVPFYKKSWFDEPMMTLTWGITTTLVIYAFGGDFINTESEGLFLIGALTIGRLVGDFVYYGLRSGVTTIGNVLVRTTEVAKLRYTTSHPSKSFVNLMQQEFAEAVFGGIASRMIESNVDASKLSIATWSNLAAFSTMGVVDFTWAQIRDRVGKTEAFGSILGSDSAHATYANALGWNAAHVVGQSILDAAFYGGVATVWYLTVGEKGFPYVFATLWFVRNAGYRAVKLGAISLYNEITCKSCSLYRRPLIKFRNGDDGNIYIGTANDQQVAFVWNYASGPRQIALANILAFKSRRPEFGKDVPEASGLSWEEIMNDNDLNRENSVRMLSRQNSVHFIEEEKELNENRNEDDNE